MRLHKVFLRHKLLKYNSEKSTAISSAPENYISSDNLSLSGCSSAEPDSVSVGKCKFQLKKLYLQTVKKVDHLPHNSFIERSNRTFRTEFLDVYLFENLQQIRNYAEVWMWKYNNKSPNSALQYFTPWDFLLRFEKKSK